MAESGVGGINLPQPDERRLIVPDGQNAILIRSIFAGYDSNHAFQRPRLFPSLPAKNMLRRLAFENQLEQDTFIVRVKSIDCFSLRCLLL